MSKASDALAKQIAAGVMPTAYRYYGHAEYKASEFEVHEWTWWARLCLRLEKFFGRLSDKGHHILRYDQNGDPIKPYLPFFHPEKRKRG